MSTDVTAGIAMAGAAAALVGGGVALFNSYKQGLWKRAELASGYLKDFRENEELVFATRCLDWNGGKLAVPKNLRPLTSDSGVIVHERKVFEDALRPDLLIKDLDRDSRLQIYRTALDSLLSWLSLISSALDRKLFRPEDTKEVSYWVTKLSTDISTHAFIEAFGYSKDMEALAFYYKVTWRFA